jgi:hypothetical protein
MVMKSYNDKLRNSLNSTSEYTRCGCYRSDTIRRKSHGSHRNSVKQHKITTTNNYNQLSTTTNDNQLQPLSTSTNSSASPSSRSSIRRTICRLFITWSVVAVFAVTIRHPQGRIIHEFLINSHDDLGQTSFDLFWLMIGIHLLLMWYYVTWLWLICELLSKHYIWLT